MTFSEFLSEFDAEPIGDVVRIGKRYFWDPTGLSAVVKKHEWDVFGLGVYLGEERRQFRPTPAMIDLIRTSSVLEVDGKAAEMFLYGKDILMKGVKGNPDFPERKLVIVRDTDGNTLGYGRIASRFDPRNGNRVYVKRLLDKGDYLRRER